MTPISSKFLKESATLNHCTGENDYSQKTYGADIALKKIQVEAAKQTSLTSLGEAASDKYLLFFDCKRSTPHGTTFEQLDKVTYEGQAMTVRKALLLPSIINPHHWEVYLS